MKLIDADKLECVSATLPHEASEDYKEGYGDGMNYVLDIIDDLPTIDPVKHGRWVDATKEIGWPVWKCSVCGGDGRGDYFVCPWCGAKMEGEEDETND